jgi:pimeloyl-ACP methyl ester carboxylesterase
VIELLKKDFNVIIPSLPGFAFSSAPPAKWTAADTARVFNTLMTKVLGYSKYATYGTDWGCAVSYSLYANFNTSVRAGHFSFLPFYPLNSTQLAAENISLSSLENSELLRFEDWATNGNAYFSEQSTEVSLAMPVVYSSLTVHS